MRAEAPTIMRVAFPPAGADVRFPSLGGQPRRCLLAGVRRPVPLGVDGSAAQCRARSRRGRVVANGTGLPAAIGADRRGPAAAVDAAGGRGGGFRALAVARPDRHAGRDDRRRSRGRFAAAAGDRGAHLSASPGIGTAARVRPGDAARRCGAATLAGDRRRPRRRRCGAQHRGRDGDRARGPRCHVSRAGPTSGSSGVAAREDGPDIRGLARSGRAVDRERFPFLELGHAADGGRHRLDDR